MRHSCSSIGQQAMQDADPWGMILICALTWCLRALSRMLRSRLNPRRVGGLAELRNSRLWRQLDFGRKEVYVKKPCQEVGPRRRMGSLRVTDHVLGWQDTGGILKRLSRVAAMELNSEVAGGEVLGPLNDLPGDLGETLLTEYLRHAVRTPERTHLIDKNQTPE